RVDRPGTLVLRPARMQPPAGEFETTVHLTAVDELTHHGGLRARGDAVGRFPLSCTVSARGDVGAQQPVTVECQRESSAHREPPSGCPQYAPRRGSGPCRCRTVRRTVAHRHDGRRLGRLLIAEGQSEGGCRRRAAGAGRFRDQVRKRGTRSKVRNSATIHMAKPPTKDHRVSRLITYRPPAKSPNSTRNRTMLRIRLLPGDVVLDSRASTSRVACSVLML